MTTTQSSILEELVDLDPCGVPFTGGPAGTASYVPLPGLPAKALIATVVPTVAVALSAALVDRDRV